VFRWNFEGSYLGRRVKYICGPDGVEQLQDPQDGDYFLATRLVPPGTSVRYMGCIPDDDDLYTGGGATVQAFAHFVYVHCDREFVISDLQGSCTYASYLKETADHVCCRH
jgi:hypothetical protein